MTILLETFSSVRRRVASMPSTPGMRMSIRTTSGCSVRTASIAVGPSAASPTTSRSGWASRIIRKPARTSAWSSTMRTRIKPPPCPPPEGEGLLTGIGGGNVQRQTGVDRESSGTIAACMKLAAEQRDTLAHPDQPVSRRGGRIAPVAGAIVADVESEHRFRVMHPDIDAPCAGMLENVGRCLLHDSVSGQVDGRWEGSRLAIDSGVDLEPGGAQSLDQAG